MLCSLSCMTVVLHLCFVQPVLTLTGMWCEMWKYPGSTCCDVRVNPPVSPLSLRCRRSAESWPEVSAHLCCEALVLSAHSSLHCTAYTTLIWAGQASASECCWAQRARVCGICRKSSSVSQILLWCKWCWCRFFYSFCSVSRRGLEEGPVWVTTRSKHLPDVFLLPLLVLAGALWARWCRVQITSSLRPSGWWESKSKYLCVCVGSLYALMSGPLSSLMCTAQCKKARLLPCFWPRCHPRT